MVVAAGGWRRHDARCRLQGARAQLRVRRPRHRPAGPACPRVSRPPLRRRGSRSSPVVDVGGGMFLVGEGSVALSVSSADGGEVTLAVLKPPQTFGELAVVDDGPRAATATARTASFVVCIPRQQVLRLLRESPDVAAALLSALAALIRQVDERATDLGPCRPAGTCGEVPRGGCEPGAGRASPGHSCACGPATEPDRAGTARRRFAAAGQPGDRRTGGQWCDRAPSVRTSCRFARICSTSPSEASSRLDCHPHDGQRATASRSWRARSSSVNLLRGQVVGEVGRRGRARDQQHVRRQLQQPLQGDLRRGGSEPGRCRDDHRAGEHRVVRGRAASRAGRTARRRCRGSGTRPGPGCRVRSARWNRFCTQTISVPCSGVPELFEADVAQPDAGDEPVVAGRHHRGQLVVEACVDAARRRAGAGSPPPAGSIRRLRRFSSMPGAQLVAARRTAGPAPPSSRRAATLLTIARPARVRVAAPRGSAR